MTKANSPALSIGWLIPAVIFLIGFSVPEDSQAQTTVQIQFNSGFVYQGGKKSRGLRSTTSCISLPDLNAILAPTPPPVPKAIPVVQKTTQPIQPQTQTHSTNPRFGYGSNNGGTVQPQPQPQPFDPRVPIDPGYDTAPVPPVQKQPAPQPTQPSVPSISGPIYQLERYNSMIPFFHGYAPYSFHYYSPYAGFYYNSRRAPLRGSCTSSRNYLSLGHPRLFFRFSF